MATGDVVDFNQFTEDMGNKLHNMSTDTFKMGIVTNATVPAATTADPRWGAGGTTNFATNEVTPGGNYSAGGPSLSAVITDNWTRSAGTSKFDGDDVSIAAHASNPTGAYWGIVYNDTDAGKRCVAYCELGGPVDMTGGLTVTWNASGIMDYS